MARTFNDGIRVLWSSGGDPIFRDHTGRKHPLTVLNLRRVCEALRREANLASRERRERDFIALSTVWAEADRALKDTIQWRMASRGLFLVQEDAA